MSTPLALCQAWVSRVVVGLDLCPWAAQPLATGGVRWRSTQAEDLAELVAEVLFESQILTESPDITTTLLVLSGLGVVPEFEDLLDLVDISDAVLEQHDLAETVQLVAFHPGFCFADTAFDDPTNGTNRSPAPMVHLLRRGDVAALTVDGAAFSERNAAILRAHAATVAERED